MRLNVYTFFDRKAGFYSHPVFNNLTPAQYSELLMRAARNGGLPDNLKAGQDLYFIGTYDDVCCVFDLLPNREFVCSPEEYFDREVSDHE